MFFTMRVYRRIHRAGPPQLVLRWMSLSGSAALGSLLYHIFGTGLTRTPVTLDAEVVIWNVTLAIITSTTELHKSNFNIVEME